MHHAAMNIAAITGPITKPVRPERAGAAKRRHEHAEARAGARYNVAKEKCADLAGNPKDVGVKHAFRTANATDAAAARAPRIKRVPG